MIKSCHIRCSSITYKAQCGFCTRILCCIFNCLCHSFCISGAGPIYDCYLCHVKLLLSNSYIMNYYLFILLIKTCLVNLPLFITNFYSKIYFFKSSNFFCLTIFLFPIISRKELVNSNCSASELIIPKEMK